MNRKHVIGCYRPRSETGHRNGIAGGVRHQSGAHRGRCSVGVEGEVYGLSQPLYSHMIFQSSEREKKEMQGLNERLGNYIDRVKGLEERNRKLVADLEDVRGKWGSETYDIKVS